jgi:hypothetical protein
MARRGWGRSIFIAALAAAGTAAAQLGLGYGLDIVVWTPPAKDAADAAWAAGLTWTVWAAATSVVVGASIGDRVGGTVHNGRISRGASRATTALAAAIGGLITIPLVAVPTQRLADIDTFAPHLLAGIYAAAGVVLGLVVALFAIGSRAMAANVFATAGFLWALAIVAVNANGRTEVTQLGIWKFTSEGPIWHQFYIPGALLMLGGALMIGGLAAFPAAGRGEGRFGVAISGMTGPALVAAAYALASPRPGHATFEQLSAFSTAPYMIVAGLLGSALVAAVGAAPRRSGPAPVGRTPSPAPAPPAPVDYASPAAQTQITPTHAQAGPAPAAGRRSTPLGATSASAVTAKASVPASSLASPDDQWPRR